ncbi:diaminobutyrate acetyltransferase [Nocardiopsis coralliicola]
MTPGASSADAATGSRSGGSGSAGDGITLARPALEHGPDLWRLARDCGLDLNSAYAYTLWCRDFAETSVIAHDAGGAPCGYVIGYRRPDAPGTYFLWQVGVAGRMRGRRLARRMLDHLAERFPAQGVTRLEATVTPDNAASRALFGSFAAAHGAEAQWSPLFAMEHFPSEGEGHEPEDLVRIGPLAGPHSPAPGSDSPAP